MESVDQAERIPPREDRSNLLNRPTTYVAVDPAKYQSSLRMMFLLGGLVGLALGILIGVFVL